LCELVPPGGNFGYDVLVHAGKALYLRHRNEEEVVEELAQRNIRISPREISLLGRKFIVYLAIAHSRCARNIQEAMRLRGGYVCHLDATCEGGDPLLMSSLDSLSEIVLGSIKIPTEAQKHIVPFLERIKQAFGIPLALVHDMGAGILKAVAEVFPGVADFVCHFHFLRDIGIDFIGNEYDLIRNRLRKHGIRSKLRHRAKELKRKMDQNPEMMEGLQADIEEMSLPTAHRQWLPCINSYSLIHWALEGNTDGNGYGFPFDRPHLAFAKRLRDLHFHLEKLKEIQLRGEWKGYRPYFKTLVRIAPQSGCRGINDGGEKTNIGAIEKRVEKFRAWLINRKGYSHDQDAQNMIGQINKYWATLCRSHHRPDPIRHGPNPATKNQQHPRTILPLLETRQSPQDRNPIFKPDAADHTRRNPSG
jgi:hypothetical protein